MFLYFDFKLEMLSRIQGDTFFVVYKKQGQGGRFQPQSSGKHLYSIL